MAIGVNANCHTQHTCFWEGTEMLNFFGNYKWNLTRLPDIIKVVT